MGLLSPVTIGKEVKTGQQIHSSEESDITTSVQGVVLILSHEHIILSTSCSSLLYQDQYFKLVENSLDIESCVGIKI